MIRIRLNIQIYYPVRVSVIGLNTVHMSHSTFPNLLAR